MHKFKLLFSVLMLLNCTLLMAEGIVKGRITEASNPEEGIAFANVVIEGTQIGGTTDLDGNFEFRVDEGSYNLKISFIGYETVSVGVTIKEEEETVINASLAESSMSLESVVLTGKVDRESEASILLEQKKSVELVQSIGAKELSKKGVSNVADGVAKVVGITKSSGAKQIFVRGMGDRYNNAMLNGLPIPSPNPDLKMIPLDIFPSKVVQQLSVMKVFSPKYYGDFAGATVDIKTKDYPEEGYWDVSVSTGINSNTTFKEFKRADGGSLSFFGINNGDRSLPTEIKNDVKYRSSRYSNGNPFKTGLSPNVYTAMPDMSVAVSGGNYFQKSDGRSFGYMTSLSFKNSSRFNNGTIRNYRTQGSTRLNYDFDKYSFATNFTGLLNLFYGMEDKFSLKFNTLFINDTQDSYSEYYGVNLDALDRNIYSVRASFMQNNLWVNQLLGDYTLSDKMDLSAGLSYSLAMSQEPDRKNLLYSEKENGAFSIYNLNNGDNHRFWSEMTDHEVAGRVKVDYNINESISGKALTKLTVGLDGKSKARKFDSWQVNYLFDNATNISNKYSDLDLDNPDNYYTDEELANGGYSLKLLPNPSSAYEVDASQYAGYVNFEHDFIPEIFRMSVGVRAETGLQEVRYKKLGDLSSGPFRVAEQNGTDILPAFSLRYVLNEQSNLRFGFSNTITRPKFKEVAPFLFKEFFGGQEFIGNPELTNGTNYNVDVKYEIFPDRGGLFAVTTFGKILKDPIEKVLKGGTTYTYENTKEAMVYGVEAEANVKLDRQLSMGTNISYLYTQINIGGDDETNLNTNNKRALQGAAPLIMNFDISYSWKRDNSSTNVALVYSYVSRKLFAAGTEGAGDQFELGISRLNLIVKNKLANDWSLDFSINNILNPYTRIVQEVSEFDNATNDAYRQEYNGDLLMNEFQTGISMGISLAKKF